PKGMQTPWRKFIAIHMNVMVACDFFCKTVWTPLGKHVVFVLTFVHLGSRKVFVSPSTLNPTGEWMRQQARNASMWAEDEGIDVRFLIHDRDTKFTDAFDEHFRRDDGGPVLTPYGAPVANCFAESWTGSLKRECLNLLFCFSLRQLDHIVQAYVLYHNKFRPHQSLGNRPLGTDEDPSPQEGETESGVIRRRCWLGGLLKHYYCQAA
ncbi:MAG: transposase, partial [Lentisphaerae bacterium]|nr:transposase [Lentisphaerota bacterium]